MTEARRQGDPQERRSASPEAERRSDEPGLSGAPTAEVGRLVEETLRAALPTLGGWLDEASIRRNVLEAIAHLAPRLPGEAAPAFGRSELLAVGERIVLAQPLAVADGRPHPHAVLWYHAGPPLAKGADDRPPAAAGQDFAGWQELGAAATRRFASLGVHHVAIFVHGDAAAMRGRIDSHGGASPASYKRWLAAPLEELRRREPPPHAARIRVTTPTDLAFWPEYQRMYEEFWQSSPELRSRIGMETQDDLEEYRRQGGLRLVWIDDRLAGLIGGVRHAELGLRGWRLRERVLGGAFRGAGWATAALDAVLRDLPAEPGDLLWGTILPDNLGSMRSALNVGRVDVGGLWWVR